MDTRYAVLFPFLFGGAFIEAVAGLGGIVSPRTFPFLFGGAFIEASRRRPPMTNEKTDFPSFSEGLSLRPRGVL